MGLDIYIQPDYQDYDDDQLHLSYQEFEKLKVPDVHDFAYRGSERQFDKYWRLYNQLDDYFTEQSEAVASIHVGYLVFASICELVVDNVPKADGLTNEEQATVTYLLNHEIDAVYPREEVQKLAAFMNHYPLTNANRQLLIQRGFLSEYQAFVDLVQQAAAQGTALEFS